MKFFVVFLFVLTFQVSARGYGQEAKVTLNLEKASFHEMVRALERSTGYTFLYRDEQVKGITNLSLKCKDKELNAVLEECLRNTGLAYRLVDQTIVIIPASGIPAAPQVKNIKITGQVSDPKGHPLPGVTVLLKGTSSGVATDVDGNFELQIPQGKQSVLVFSFIGMKTKEVPVMGDKPVKVTLEEDAEVMDEVVVTGYQSIKSGRATGSFQIVKAENMDNIFAVDFTKKIEGIVPGLMVNPDGTMVIRGKGTFNAKTEPLIVVDGFPMESSTLNLNPADIDQITVLKDAASASIYGVRGANGVVVITTKRGGESGKLSVSASANIQIGQKPSFSSLELLGSSGHVDLEWELYNAGVLNQALMYGNKYSEVGGIYQRLTGGELTEVQAMQELAKYKSYDNRKDLEKYFYQNELTQQYNVSLRGGSEKYSFYASVGFNKEQANLVGNDNWRTNFIINNDINFTPKIKLQVGLKGNYYKKEVNGVDILADGIRPYIRMLDEQGRYVNEYAGVVQQSAKDDLSTKGYLNWDHNRLQNQRLNDNTLKGSNVTANINFSVDVFDGLNLSTGFVYEAGADKQDNYSPLESYRARDLINRFTYMDPVSGALTYNIPKGGTLITNNSWLYNWTWRGTAAYTKSLGDFDFSLSTGMEMSSFRTVSTKDYYYGYNPQTLTNIQINTAELNIGVPGYKPGSRSALYEKNSRGDVENRYASFFALANVTYKKRYDLFGSYRLDKTNLFGRSPEYRDNPSYSVGAKWTLSSEKFFDVEKISRLAIKGSYGVSGNIDKSTSPYLIGSETADYWTGVPSLQFMYPENPLLSWEKSFVWNIGVEFGLFNDRLTGSLEYYNKKSTDVLAAEQVDYTNGWGSSIFAAVMKNSASILNRGIDLNLNGVVVDKAIKYNMGLTLSYNHNNVVSINRATASVNDLSSNTPMKGKPADYVYAYQNAGLDQNGEPMVYNRNGEKLLWSDMGSLTLDDIDFVGRSIAPVYGAWTNNLRYKDLFLDFMFTFKLGHKVRLPYTARSNDAQNNFVHESIADRWQESGDENKTWIPKISDSNWEDGQRQLSTSMSDKLIDGGAIIRLRSLNIGYNLKSLIGKNNFVKDLTVKASAENLFYWSKSGYDTDYLVDNKLSFPAARRYTVGVTLQF